MKFYKGQIIIFKQKSNTGIILLENGNESQVTQFDPIFEDEDRVEVSFKNDDVFNDIIDIKSDTDVDYYGFMITYKKGKNYGTVVCNYPKMLGSISYNLNISLDTNKSFPLVKFNILKTDSKMKAQNFKVLNENDTESFKCSSPIFGTIREFNKKYFLMYNISFKNK